MSPRGEFNAGVHAEICVDRAISRKALLAGNMGKGNLKALESGKKPPITRVSDEDDGLDQPALWADIRLTAKEHDDA
jgi:hypothetical protein